MAARGDHVAFKERHIQVVAPNMVALEIAAETMKLSTPTLEKSSVTTAPPALFAHIRY